MSFPSWLKQNFVLILGLALPALLMLGFLVASQMPNPLEDPPKYDFVFSVEDYQSGGGNTVPVVVRLVVKDGTLMAQYTRRHDQNTYSYWKKIYVYEAATQKVRELGFGYPSDMASITDMREEAVEALKGKKLDTTLQAPDGYELSHGGYSHSGLVNELLWGGGHSQEPRLRKGSSSVRLATGDPNRAFYYGNIQFVGWIVP